LFLNIY